MGLKALRRGRWEVGCGLGCCERLALEVERVLAAEVAVAPRGSEAVIERSAPARGPRREKDVREVGALGACQELSSKCGRPRRREVSGPLQSGQLVTSMPARRSRSARQSSRGVAAFAGGSSAGAPC